MWYNYLIPPVVGAIIGYFTIDYKSIVKLNVLGGLTVSATISNNAVAELDLKTGDDALAVIKATSVMVGID